jgi:hypothetical protein
MVQSYKTLGHLERLSGHDGETDYLIVTFRKTYMLWGISTKGKMTPIAWITRWFEQYRPKDVRHRYTAIDKGGELTNNPKIMALLDTYEYTPHPTSPMAFNQNAPGKRPHHTIGNVLRTMLTEANMDFNFWPYAFYYIMFLHNVLPHLDKGVPYTRAGFRCPSLSRIHTFGCHVYVRPPSKRNKKLDNNVCCSLFIGFTSTMSQIHYYALDTKRFKTTTRVKFDEGISYLEIPTPHSKQLRDALDSKYLPPDDM